MGWWDVQFAHNHVLARGMPLEEVVWATLTLLLIRGVCAKKAASCEAAVSYAPSKLQQIKPPKTPKRTEWDSNPRAAFTTAGFPDQCIRPLCHPSPSKGKNFDADFDAGEAQRSPQNVKMNPEVILRLADRLAALTPNLIVILTDLLGQEPADQQPADDSMATRQGGSN